jgi:hypothetical protein
MDIKNYSKMYKILRHSQWHQGKSYAEVLVEAEEIIIKENNVEIKIISIKDINKKLIEKFSKNEKFKLDKQDLIFELEN